MLRADALQLEASAVYRDETLVQNTPSAQQAFRSRYPQAGEVADSRVREPVLALRDARANGSLRALADFLSRYESWPEAGPSLKTAREELIARHWAQAKGGRLADLRGFRERFGARSEAASLLPEARRVEAARALLEARQAGTASALETLRSEYGDWPELQALAPELEDEVAKVAFEEARRERSIEALDDFRASYPAPRWQQAATVALTTLALELLLEETDASKWHPTVRAFFAEHGALPTFTGSVSALEPRVWLQAEKARSPFWYTVYRELYPGNARATQARTVERTLRAAAADQGSTSALLDFVRFHPADARTPEFEARLERRFASERASRASLVPSVELVRSVERGKTQVTFDVRDCEGRRVNGLRADDFELLVAGAPATLTGFQGLDEERPLDVVFAIDLSGSMETEHEAVRRATLQFAETFRFRNRERRIGLVTFSDDVGEVYAPTSNSALFLRWMNALKDTSGGGTGEDAAHALLRAASQPFARNAERVLILLTDEPLQMNRGGMRALGISAETQCRKLQSFSRCLFACKNRRCYVGCFGTFGGPTKRAFAQCSQRFGADTCLGVFVPWEQVKAGMSACTEYLTPGSEGLDRLASRLQKQQVRLYLVVSEEDALAPSGFDALVERIGGRVLPVPQDASESEPYEAALLEIADQLSKQYRVDLAGSIGAGDVELRVRTPRLWSELGPVPEGEWVALLPGPVSEGCGSVVAVARNGALATFDGCTATWRRAHGKPQVTVTDVVSTPTGALALGAGGELLQLDVELLQWGPVEDAPAGLHRITMTPSGIVWAAAGAAGEQAGLWRWSARDEDAALPWSGPQFIPPDFGPQASLYTHDSGLREEVCLLEQGRRACTVSAGRTWRVEQALWLPDGVVDLSVRRTAPSRTHIVATDASGWAGRSIDGGRTWKTLWNEPGAPAVFVETPGPSPVVCAALAGEVRCSEDHGLTWRREGEAFDDGAPGLLATLGARIYLARAGKLHRLDEVQSRESPSASVYFDTDSAVPHPQMRPFVEDLATRLRQEGELLVRIEGHADARGSERHNDALAAARAEAVRTMLVQLGVAEERVRALSFGKARPVRRGSSAEDHARNRRVELIVLKAVPIEGSGCPVDDRPSGSPHLSWSR